MPVAFTCPGCQKRLVVPEDKLGYKVSCPGCRSLLNTARRPDSTAIQASPKPKPAPAPAPAPAKPRSFWVDPKAASRRQTRIAVLILALVALSVGGYLAFGIDWKGREKSNGPGLADNDRPRVYIFPPKFEKVKLVRELPGPVDELAVAGNGRYLLLHIPRVKKIGLFDATEAKIVHFFPVPDDPILFGGSYDKLVLVNKTTRTIERYNLVTHEKELSAQVPDGSELGSLSLGWASDGPIAIAGNDRAKSNFTFLNLADLKPLDIRLADGHNGFGGKIRVSADGSAFGVWSHLHAPTGMQSYLLDGQTLKGRYLHANVGHVAPGPDGAILYTGHGLFGNDTLPLDRPVTPDRPEGVERFTLPALHGNYYFSFSFLAPEEGAQPSASQASIIQVHLADKVKPLIYMKGIDLGVPTDRSFRPTGPDFDKRFLFIPEAKLFVVLPYLNDELWIYRLDVEEALEKAGGESLHVANRPSALAVRGQTFSYALKARSGKGRVEFDLDASPKGMTISDKGRLEWRVPSDFPTHMEDVTILLSDASGQEAVHLFKVMIVDPPGRK